MQWSPQKGCELYQSNWGSGTDGLGGGGVTTPGHFLTSGAAASTKGTPVEIFSSTLFDAYWVRITASQIGASAANSRACLDILLGAATEYVLIPNLLAGAAGQLGAALDVGPKTWDFPLRIPAGSRVAAQIACDRTSQSDLLIGIELFGGLGTCGWAGTKVDTYGIGTVPAATAITAGASGAAGAYAQIVASTSRAHKALVPSFQIGADATVNLRAVKVGIGVGAATEESLYDCFYYLTTTNERMSGPHQMRPILRDIPASSRLAMRASSSGTVDSFDGAIHGVS